MKRDLSNLQKKDSLLTKVMNLKCKFCPMKEYCQKKEDKK